MLLKTHRTLKIEGCATGFAYQVMQPHMSLSCSDKWQSLLCISFSYTEVLFDKKMEVRAC